MRRLLYPSVLLWLAAIGAMIGYYVETKSFLPMIATIPMVIGSGVLAYLAVKRNLNIMRSELHYSVMALCYVMYAAGFGRYDHTEISLLIIAFAVVYLSYIDFKFFQKIYEKNELTKQLGVVPDHIYYRGGDFKSIKELVIRKNNIRTEYAEYKYNGITFNKDGIKNGNDYAVLQKYFKDTETTAKNFTKEDLEVLTMYSI